MSTVRARVRAALSATGIAAVTGLLLYGFLSAESEKTVGLILLGAVSLGALRVLRARNRLEFLGVGR